MEKEKEDRHTHFFRSFGRFGPAMPSFEKVLEELLRRAASQRISHLELMTDAAEISENGAVDSDALKKRLLYLDDVRKNVLAGLDERDKGWNVDVAYILALNRGESIPEEMRKAFDESAYEKYFGKQVKDVMDLAVDLHEYGVCGITLLAPEDSWISRTFFDLQMKAFDETWRSFSEEDRKKLKFNLHAGELTVEYSPYEAMRNRISETISKSHSSRIGHGTSILWEDDVYGLLGEMREKGIAVETSPSSGEEILGVSGGLRHPFRLYWDAGVPVVICTDDEGISRSNLTLEYAKAAVRFGLEYGELKWLVFNSIEYSFLPGESLFANGDFNKRKIETDSLLQSPKARKQIELWNAFLEFESRMERNIERFGS
jgi:adenosine deaminase